MFHFSLSFRFLLFIVIPHRHFFAFFQFWTHHPYNFPGLFSYIIYICIHTSIMFCSVWHRPYTLCACLLLLCMFFAITQRLYYTTMREENISPRSYSNIIRVLHILLYYSRSVSALCHPFAWSTNRSARNSIGSKSNVFIHFPRIAVWSSDNCNFASRSCLEFRFRDEHYTWSYVLHTRKT